MQLRLCLGAGSASKAAIQDIVQEGQTKAGELAEEAQAAIRERVVKDHRTSQDEVRFVPQWSRVAVPQAALYACMA